ncbi:hypothetical protein [Pseudogemmobacter sonorensis]|uniref:hypothetical protein n=1 Tax=Pseudogemmobacter sonorensis TaxID=2989681 RepID=UPI003682AF50
MGLTLVPLLMLAGCELALPSGGGGAAATGPNPVTGPMIEVTALEDAAAAPVAARAAAQAIPGASPPSDMTEPDTALSEVAGPESGPPAFGPSEEAAPPAARKSQAQLACEKAGGKWSRAGQAGYACVSTTRDNGKACTRASQCESACLARSGSCAPWKPLFGCNEILDDMGRRMTQCLE